MTTGEPIQRIRIYLSERDSAEGQPLYLHVLERLRREGASGATAMRGIAGFGAGHRLRTAGMVELNQAAPIIVEWLDRADRVARVLPVLDSLLGDTLVTIEEIRAYRAELRSGGPFGGRSVADVARGTALIAAAHEMLPEALIRLAEARQALLAVVDGTRLVGAILADDTMRMGAPPLAVLSELDAAERVAALARVPARQLREAVNESRTIYIESSVAQTVNLLVEWGLDALPVVDRQGQVAGVFGVEQALLAALDIDKGSGHVRDAEPPAPVSLIMQMMVPTAAATSAAPAALGQLLQTPLGALVLMDGARPVGLLSIAGATRQLRDAARAAWVAVLAGDKSQLPAVTEAAARLTVADLATQDLAMIQSRASEYDAIRALLEGGRQQLVVVDDEGRLAGMVTRRGLLRALAQESSA